MRRYRVLVAAPAEVEIEAAYLFIRRDSPEHAARWRRGLLEAAKSLCVHPNRCRLAPESGGFEYEIRQLIYGNYRLLFTVRGTTVVILHVRHGARRPMDPDEVGPP